MSTTNKISTYKVKIAQISPNIELEGIKDHHAYVGISLNNPLFWHESFKSVIDWTLSNFKKTLFLVVDYPHRINSIIFNGLSPELSSQEAIEEGLKFKNNLDQILKQVQGSFQIMRWIDLQKTAHFNESLNIIQQVYATNVKFKESIDGSASDFIDRNKKRGNLLAIPENDANLLSIEYILEEIAGCLLLEKMGWGIQIYPGTQLQVFKDISSGLINSTIPKELKRTVYIELKVSKKI